MQERGMCRVPASCGSQASSNAILFPRFNRIALIGSVQSYRIDRWSRSEILAAEFLHIIDCMLCIYPFKGKNKSTGVFMRPPVDQQTCPRFRIINQGYRHRLITVCFCISR